MRVLIIGSGAREHAMAWKLNASPSVKSILVAPGNGGTATIGTNLRINPNNIDGLIDAASRYKVDLTVVGPEVPLSNGIIDRFQQVGIPAFGPTKGAAKLEFSKSYARDLMKRHKVPSPDFQVFHSYGEAYDFVSNHEGRLVVKADGLAAGKGSFICETREAAINALHDCMEDHIFGAAGNTVVVEELLEGEEISVFAFVDGHNISKMMAARDYKRLLDGDKGPNTGGMGSYSPVKLWDNKLSEKVRKEVMEPVVKAMATEGNPFKGMLYAGLMVTPSGIKVLEFNCRFGDPEAQVILPLLKADFSELMLKTVNGQINKTADIWEKKSSVGVVVAARGYPGTYRKVFEIEGLDTMDPEVLVFHAGTRRRDGPNGGFVTTSGRVLTVVGQGTNLEDTRKLVYDNLQRVFFSGCQYRKDIALQ